MARELITDWTAYAAAFDRLLALASEKIDIYDEDLGHLGLESPDRQQSLQRILNAGRSSHEKKLRIAVRNASLLRKNPGLLKLLATYGHIASAEETPPHIAHLRDGIVLVDQRHALVRFERDMPRGKLLIDEPDEIRAYIGRFDEILGEGGEPVSALTLGL
jgi:hypothetical protein